MAIHCSDHESLVFHGQVLGAEESVSVCLEPGLQYGFHYGIVGKPLLASFSVDSTQVRGGFDWERVGETDWVSLALTFDGVTYTIRVSRPESEGELPQAAMTVEGPGVGADLVFEPGSVVSALPFD